MGLAAFFAISTLMGGPGVRLLVQAVCVVAGLSCGAQVAWGRALPPSAMPVIKQALDAVDACSVDGIAIGPYDNRARLCLRAAPSSCFTVQLSDPQLPCTGTVSGAWCLHWPDGDPPPAVRQAITAALGNSPSPWFEPELSRDGSVAPSEPMEPAIALHPKPLALALAFLALPLMAGIAAARHLRRHHWSRSLGCAVGLAIATIALVLLLPAGSVWDAVSLAALVIVGAMLGAAQITPTRACVLAVSSILAVGGLELAVRRWMPVPPRFPPPEDAAFIGAARSLDEQSCAVLYAPDLDREIRALRGSGGDARPPKGPLVVHLGDSMTYGTGVRQEEAFPALLDARDAAAEHANYGVTSVGTDFEFLVLQRVLDAHHPDLVVVHIFTGNDLSDVDRPYECCAMDSLLAYPPAGPTAGCVAPRWSTTLGRRFGRSAPPYPLRVATAWSYAARHATAGFARLVSNLDVSFDLPTDRERGPDSWAHWEQILRALRDELAARDIGFAVTILPQRMALESGDRDAAAARVGRRVAAITAQLGIRTFDAWDLFAEAVRRDGGRRYFIDESDVHFSPSGHRLLAEWLAPQLTVLRQTSRAQTRIDTRTVAP